MKMNLHIWLKSYGLIYLLVISILLAMLPSFVWGQLPFNTIKAEQVATKPEEAETTEQLLEHLQQLLSKAQQSLNSVQPTLETASPEQLWATIEEIKEKQFLLFTRVLRLNRHIESLRSLEETRHAIEDLTIKVEAWQGFNQSPPYPIRLVDELRDSIHAKSLAIAKEEVSKTLTDQGQKDARKILVSSEQELRKIKESLERPLSADDKFRKNWLYELAQLRNDVAGVGVLASKAQLQTSDAILSLDKRQKTFLERQLQVAVTDVLFSDDELELKLALLTKKLKALDKEKLQLTSDNNRNQKKLHQARGALQKAREALLRTEEAQGKTEGDQGQTEEVNYLQAVVETRKAQTDVSAQMVKLQIFWVMGIKSEIASWKERYQLSRGGDEIELRQAAKSLEKRLKETQENRVYIVSNLKLARILVLNVEEHLAVATLAGKEDLLAKQKLVAYKHQIEFFSRLLTDIDDVVRNTQRFQDEVAYYRQRASAAERLQGIFDRSLELVGAVWTYELFVVEDTISVNGQLVTSQRPVTISKVVRALSILILGFWITLLLRHRLGGLVAKIFKVEPSTALLLEKFLQIVAIFILVIIALVTVKIPLTAFAFMGGALAIGVGFGAQALINNFISGIILLFERPVKPGDMVEVEGVKGKVISIGLRCSQVRRFDGIDILVPNSDFLQKNVINWTLSDQLIRLQVKIGVAYGSPTREVARIIADALEEHGKILKSPEPIILFEDFGDSALIFSAYFWVEINPDFDYRIIASDLRHMLDKRLDAANITIAFPQLDVHLDNSKMKMSKLKEKQVEGS
jgi:small-conductance mechanosensitive channel